MESLLEKALVTKVMDKMILYFGHDARMVQHTLKVHNFAKSIGVLEGISREELQILEIAAILHDIGVTESNKKHGTSKFHEVEGPPVAAELLKAFLLGREFLDRVYYMIGNHHKYDKVDKIDFQALFEADYLVNIFEGNVKDEQLPEIREKYFRTNTGTAYFDSMYSTEN